jgi:CBS domain-containing protein
MSLKIADLMAKDVIRAQPHHTVDHVRGLMRRNRILAVPVVGPDDEPVGIITSSDMLQDLNGATPISNLMTERVYKVPAYNDVNIAARIMRQHRIHHVVVTHEQKLVGIISSFDLLQLVEDHRFDAKGKLAPPKPAPRKGRKRFSSISP